MKEQILTERELEVLELLSQGLGKNEIARKLSVTIHTVKAHTESVYRKLAVKNKIQAVVFAIKIGILNI